MDEIMYDQEFHQNSGDDWEGEDDLKPITNERLVDPEIMVSIKKKRDPVDNINSLKRKHCWSEQPKFIRKKYYNHKRYQNNFHDNCFQDSNNAKKNNNSSNNLNNNSNNNSNRRNYMPLRFKARYKKMKLSHECDDESSQTDDSMVDDLDNSNSDSLAVDEIKPILNKKEQIDMDLEFVNVLSKMNGNLNMD